VPVINRLASDYYPGKLELLEVSAPPLFNGPFKKSKKRPGHVIPNINKRRSRSDTNE